MTGCGSRVDEWFSGPPEFTKALNHVVELGLVNLDPWVLLIFEERVNARSEAVNQRYPTRNVRCFAERVDTDDVACVILRTSEEYSTGQVLIVHDFAEAGSEVDAVLPSFWAWFRLAIDDMIDVFLHWDDSR